MLQIHSTPSVSNKPPNSDSTVSERSLLLSKINSTEQKYVSCVYIIVQERFACWQCFYCQSVLYLSMHIADPTSVHTRHTYVSTAEHSRTH